MLRVYFGSSAKAKRVLYCLALTNPASPLSTVQWSTNSSMLSGGRHPLATAQHHELSDCLHWMAACWGNSWRS
ncbi:hypothetical protein ACWDRB_66595 [Nonomuraea sp. NPDC003707]